MNLHHDVVTEKYMINDKSLLIVPNQNPYECLIYESDRVILCRTPSKDIVEDSCLKVGSSLQGRRDFVKTILSNKHKPPVPIDTDKGLIFMPTKSFHKLECAWISYNHLIDIEPCTKYPNHRTKLTFSNEETYDIEVHVSQLNKLISMASQIFGHIKKNYFLDLT